MALSRPASRRIAGFPTLALLIAIVLFLVAGVANRVTMAWAGAALLVVVTGFWLFDRGIPGNRPRPGWLRAWAVLLVLMAAVVLLLSVSALRAGTS